MVLAYTLLLRGTARELVLVGSNRMKAEGEAQDLTHAQAFLQVPVKIRAGGMEATAGSDVVAICASVPMPGDILTRNALAEGNARLMMEVVPKVAAYSPGCILLMVTNPVDALTWQALELSGFPPERVIGTGTLVDSIRFRELLSGELGIHPDDLRAYVLGEHGEHQFPAMSVAQAGGERIEDTEARRAFCEAAARSGMEVFRKKRNTCYAIGQAASYVIESIAYDERRTVPLSVRIDDYLGVNGVCLSLPVVVGKKGIERVLHPALDEREQAAFRKAGVAVAETIELVKRVMEAGS